MLAPEVLLDEIARQEKRVKNESLIIETRKELATNIYPLMRMMVESMLGASGQVLTDILQRLELAEGVIAEYLSSQESVILPDLAVRLHATLAIGFELCDRAEALLALLPDETFSAGTDAATVRDEVVALMEGFREAGKNSRNLIQEVELEEIPGDDEDDESAPEASKEG